MNISQQSDLITSLPEHNEYEISVLGAGYGESIVIHSGYGEWIIVDSCMFHKQKVPGPLEYLNKIGVQVDEQVKVIIATHWDDDHIRGIGEIVENCKSSKFVMSAALKDDKFLRLVIDSPLSKSVELGQRGITGISEFKKVYACLKSRGQTPILAGINRTLWKSNKNSEHALFSLSPDDSVFEKAVQSILTHIPQGNSSIGRILPPKPNHTSIVLWVKLSNEYVLLGADMEEIQCFKGWTTIIENQLIIDKKAQIYKVAHHGSHTGHHDGIWDELLLKNPYCFIAPWKLAGNHLPNEDDKRRLTSKSNQVHITSNGPIQFKYPKNENKHVNRALKKIDAEFIFNPFSMIRCRKRLDTDNWSIEHFGNASQIN